MEIADLIEYQKQFIQKIITACGPRLPGSPEEKKGAEMIAEEFRSVTGNAKIDEFTLHPHAFIGWIPIAGFGLMVSAILVMFYPLAAAILNVCLFSFAIIQFIKYKQWFDFLFPKATSQNVYSVVEPPSGVAQYTILLSGHIDSSWCWNLPIKHSERMRYKIYYGFLGGFLVIVMGIIRVCEFYLGEGLGTGTSFKWMFYIIPFMFPGFYYIHRFLTWDKTKASPGAMDNLSGIAQCLSILKYFQTHPNDQPKNARLVIVGFGSEEAGLRGSRAFVKKHKNDLLKGEVWNLNIDGVSDDYSFNLMKGEAMLATNYNTDLVNIVTAVLNEFGLYRPFWKLDVGASDAVTLCQAGKRAYTFAAQDTTPLNNYHTYMDTLDRINPEALRKMLILVLRVIEKIDRYNTDFSTEWLEDFVEKSSMVYKIKKTFFSHSIAVR
jgi:hypothetical protein